MVIMKAFLKLIRWQNLLIVITHNVTDEICSYWSLNQQNRSDTDKGGGRDTHGTSVSMV